MGRYSVPLAPLFADFAGAQARVLDVGCGPGALTAELVRRLGEQGVSAVDPSPPFVEAIRERHPGVTVERAAAEELPFAEHAFDAALAQLVVHFMADPVAGLREMARVTRDGGVVAATVWDHGGGEGPLSVYWDAVHELDPTVDDESKLAGAREGDLSRLLRAAGLRDVVETGLWVSVEHSTFETGGSRTRSALGRPATTSHVSTKRREPACASCAVSGCRSRRSRCAPGRGPREDSPRTGVQGTRVRRTAGRTPRRGARSQTPHERAPAPASQ
jgi:SAM-dependent methyltransferase